MSKNIIKPPEFKSTYRYFLDDAKDKYVWNGILGCFRVLQMHGGDGEEYKSQFVIALPKSEVVIIVKDIDSKPRIAMLRRERAAFCDPSHYKGVWDEGNVPDPLNYLDKLGSVGYELPKGLTNDYIGKEGEEESGYKLKNQKIIGRLAHELGFSMTAAQLVLAEKTKQEVELDQAEWKSIEELVWLSPEELMQMETYDTYTEAAIRKLRKYLLKLDDTEENKHWKELGRRL